MLYGVTLNVFSCDGDAAATKLFFLVFLLSLYIWTVFSTENIKRMERKKHSQQQKIWALVFSSVCVCVPRHWLVPLQRSIIILGTIMFVPLCVQHALRLVRRRAKKNHSWAELFKIRFVLGHYSLMCDVSSPKWFFFSFTWCSLFLCSRSFACVFSTNNYQQCAHFWNAFLIWCCFFSFHF